MALSFSPSAFIVRLFCGALVGLLGGCAAIPPPKAFVNLASPPRTVAPAHRAEFNAQVFDEVWDWVNRRYYDAKFNGTDWAAARTKHRPAALAATDDEGLYRELNVMLGELRDGHAHAFTPAETAQMAKRSGLLLGFRTGPVVGEPDHREILEVFPASPAARAGVQRGWILLAADARPPGEVLGPGKLRAGQTVRLTFREPTGTERNIALQPKEIRIPQIREAEELPDGVLRLRFDSFSMEATRWARAQMKAHPKSGGVIFDLRRNTGGNAFALTTLLSEIFPQPVDAGRTVVRSGSDNHHRTPTAWFGNDYRGPVAVLVSPFSASAAEIFAHVVQHHHRGVVVGETTAGKVLVSVFWWLPGGGELQLSVYDYEGPGGVRLEGRGVTPEVFVSPALPAEETPRGTEDPVIVAALKALKPEH